MTVGNAPRTDVLAQVGPGGLPIAVQVKTKSEQSKDFHLHGISEPSPPEANEWVILVALSGSQDHEYFVVPRNHVWATAQATMPENHRGLIGPQEFPAYRDAWALLERPAQDAEWRVEQWVRDKWESLPWPAGEQPVRRP